jgi:hypothetical protein
MVTHVLPAAAASSAAAAHMHYQIHWMPPMAGYLLQALQPLCARYYNTAATAAAVVTSSYYLEVLFRCVLRKHHSAWVASALTVHPADSPGTCGTG